MYLKEKYGSKYDSSYNFILVLDEVCLGVYETINDCTNYNALKPYYIKPYGITINTVTNALKKLVYNRIRDCNYRKPIKSKYVKGILYIIPISGVESYIIKDKIENNPLKVDYKCKNCTQCKYYKNGYCLAKGEKLDSYLSIERCVSTSQ